VVLEMMVVGVLLDVVGIVVTEVVVRAEVVVVVEGVDVVSAEPDDGVVAAEAEPLLPVPTACLLWNTPSMMGSIMGCAEALAEAMRARMARAPWGEKRMFDVTSGKLAA
jgi:hypothetical protein